MLKDDLERQISQRMLEMQASWDQREQLRRNAIAQASTTSPYPLQLPKMNIPIPKITTSYNMPVKIENPIYNLYSKDGHSSIGMNSSTAAQLANISNLGQDSCKFKFKEKEKIDDIEKEVKLKIFLSDQAIKKLKQETNKAKEEIKELKAELERRNKITNDNKIINEIQNLSFAEVNSKNKAINIKNNNYMKTANTILNDLKKIMSLTKTKSKLINIFKLDHFEDINMKSNTVKPIMNDAVSTNEGPVDL